MLIKSVAGLSRKHNSILGLSKNPFTLPNLSQRHLCCLEMWFQPEYLALWSDHNCNKLLKVRVLYHFYSNFSTLLLPFRPKFESWILLHCLCRLRLRRTKKYPLRIHDESSPKVVESEPENLIDALWLYTPNLEDRTVYWFANLRFFAAKLSPSTLQAQ